VILTLSISALAFVMSGVALGWQIVSWRRSGPRVRVVRIQGIGGMMPGTWFTGVKAENSGRLATEIQQFGFRLSNGMNVMALENFVGMPIQFPAPLPPGGTASVEYSAFAIRQALNQAGHDGTGARPYVDTGHGHFEGNPVDLGKEVDLMLRAETRE
jgi:hypothetical protein